MDNLLAASPVLGGKLYVFMGERRSAGSHPKMLPRLQTNVLTDGQERLGASNIGFTLIS